MADKNKWIATGFMPLPGFSTIKPAGAGPVKPPPPAVKTKSAHKPDPEYLHPNLRTLRV